MSRESRSTGRSSGTKKEAALRKGKWTTDEENYANKIIFLFNQGMLPILAGTTLRSYLSDKLSCDPMRITKKFAGASCIGKQVYQPCESFEYSMDEIREHEAQLRKLEKLFVAKISSKGRGQRGDADLSEEEEEEDEAEEVEKRESVTSTGKRKGAASTQKSDPEEISDSGDELQAAKYRFNNKKRVMSAPDLSQMDILRPHNTRQRGSQDGKRLLPDALKEYFGQPLGGESDDFFIGFQASGGKGSDTKFAVGASSPNSSMNSRRGLSSRSKHNSSLENRRSQSVMDLTEFERLVSDEKAAGTLLIKFATDLAGLYDLSRSNNSSNSGNSGLGNSSANTSGHGCIDSKESSCGQLKTLVETDEKKPVLDSNSTQMVETIEEAKDSQMHLESSSEKDHFLVDIKLEKSSKHQPDIVLIENNQTGCINVADKSHEMAGAMEVVNKYPDVLADGFRSQTDDLNCEEDSNFF